MAEDSVDRIRSATFPLRRRGYDKREVDRFLNGLADWLETGGADQTRAETVRRDLERVGEQTGKILTDAHDAGDRIRAEAERDAAQLVEQAGAEAQQARAAAEQYAAEAKAEAKRIVSEANRRRSDIEAVISDLEARRDAAVADLQRLSSELAGTATEHRPAGPGGESRGRSQRAAPSKTA